VRWCGDGSAAHMGLGVLAGLPDRRLLLRGERRRGAQVRPARVSKMIRQARTGVAAAVGDRPTASA
jgi:hypothetical protein